jgi:hypothetical protein
MGNQGGKALKWFPAHFNFERKICLLMKPALSLRLHATQSHATSNVLAHPGGNRIFAATPTERITHYTLQAKSCAKGQAPLETPDNKTG